ncbi:MerR family transcriptional regulator [Corynebacterium ureicelerivorans]
MTDGNEYTIGEAADALGVSGKALRHWEALGLITPARTWAGHRVYSEADLERGAAIALYRGVGVPLAQIEQLLDASGAALTRALKHPPGSTRFSTAHARRPTHICPAPH